MDLFLLEGKFQSHPLLTVVFDYIVQLPEEDDYDLSDVDLDDDDFLSKIELWAQTVRDLIQAGRWNLVWSGPVRPASSLLWTNGRPGRPVTEIFQKRHETPAVSHICQSHRTRREGGGRCVVSLEWPLPHIPAEHRWFKRPPPAEERREEVLNVAFQSFIQVFFKHCSPLPSSAPLKKTYF